MATGSERYLAGFAAALGLTIAGCGSSSFWDAFPLNDVADSGAGTDAGPGDAGAPVDGGIRDGGATDAGFLDAGPVDAGPPDSGPEDAGTLDAGPADAGIRDSGPDAGQSGGPFGTPISVLNAGNGEVFGSVSLAAAGTEAELFYAVEVDAGYFFVLQHLSPAGAIAGDPVQVGTGVPQLPPLVAVATDQTEVICCWDDYGITTNSSGAVKCDVRQSNPLVKCNSVGVGGTAPDRALGGGFTACGHGPSVADSAGATMLAYLQVDAAEFENVYQPPGSNKTDTDVSDIAVGVVAARGGFELLEDDGSGIEYLFEEPPYFASRWNKIAIPGVTPQGGFAGAAIGSSLGMVVQQESGLTTLVMDLDAGTPVNDANVYGYLQAMGQVAMATCTSGFGFAFALDGGDVLVGETSVTGSFLSNPTAIANLGVTAQSIGLAPSDGGLLLAVGTPTQIAVYSVSCP